TESAVVEFYLSHPADDATRPADQSGHGEAYSFIGADTCGADSLYSFLVPKTVYGYSQMTFLTTDKFGNTSEFGPNFTLIPSPLIVVAYSPVNLRVTDPNGFYIGKDADGNLTQTIINATYDEIINDSVTIPNPILGHYIIEIIPESDAPPGSTYGVGIRIDGSVQSYMVWDAAVPASGTVDTVYYSVEEGFPFVNGDPSDNGAVNILDATFLISYLYKNGPAPYPLTAGDANCNGRINILDATYIISFLFKGGPPPCQAPPK
ncbi:MAG: dockerin type I repeat-containing protein, partial [Candidatus Zixiibacteriota bacterium]